MSALFKNTLKYWLLPILLFSTYLSFNTLFAQQYVPFKTADGWNYYDATSKNLQTEVFETILPFREQLSLFQKDGKWGAKNRQLQTIISNEYDELNYLEGLDNTILKGKKGKQYFLFSSSGKALLDKETIHEAEILKGSKHYLVIGNADRKFGMMDTDGNITIEIQYVTPPKHVDNLLVLSDFTKEAFNFGAISYEGKTVIPFKYEHIKKHGNHILAREKDGNAVLFDLNGKKIMETTHPAHMFYFMSDDFVLYEKQKKIIVQPRLKPDVELEVDEQFYYKGTAVPALKEGVPVLIGKKGKITTFKNDETITRFQQGLSRVTSKAGKSRLINESGKTVFETENQIYQWNGTFVITNEKGHGAVKTLISLKTGNPVSVDPAFEVDRILQNGYVFGRNADKKGVLLDPNGKTVNLSECTYIRREHELGNAYVIENYNPETRQRVKGILTKSGKEIVAPEYYEVRALKKGRDEILPYFQIRTYTNRVYEASVVDTNGKVVIPFGTHAFLMPSDSLLISYMTKKAGNSNRNMKGVCDWTGKILIPSRYDEIREITDQGAFVTLNKRTGYCSFDGKEIMIPEFSGLTKAGDYFIASKWSRFGIFNSEGAEVVPIEYEKITYETNDDLLFKVTLNNEEFYIDAHGTKFKEKI